MDRDVPRAGRAMRHHPGTSRHRGGPASPIAATDDMLSILRTHDIDEQNREDVPGIADAPMGEIIHLRPAPLTDHLWPRHRLLMRDNGGRPQRGAGTAGRNDA
jgi:hypothetical protein